MFRHLHKKSKSLRQIIHSQGSFSAGGFKALIVMRRAVLQLIQPFFPPSLVDAVADPEASKRLPTCRTSRVVQQASKRVYMSFLIASTE
jgi:hypothetical protein